MGNSNNSNIDRMPQTGRIGRFVKILKAKIEIDAFSFILEDAIKYDSLTAEEKSAWWKNAIEKMEGRLGKDKAIQIMKECGSKCCGKGQRDTAMRLYKESGTIENFLERISKHDVREGDLTYTLVNENTIIAEHNRCFCHQVANTKERFDNLTYCHCSVEFNKQFFTSALGKEVHVELLQSIVCGAKSCKFRITI